MVGQGRAGQSRVGREEIPAQTSWANGGLLPAHYLVMSTCKSASVDSIETSGWWITYLDERARLNFETSY